MGHVRDTTRQRGRFEREERGGEEAGMLCKRRYRAKRGDGETRTRTGDTTIFSRLPSAGECGRFAAESRARPRSPYSRGFPHFGCDCGRVRHTIANLCLNDSRHAAASSRARRCCAIGSTRRPRLSDVAKVGVGSRTKARRRRARLSQPLGGCVKPGPGPCRSPQAWPLSGRLQPTRGSPRLRLGSAGPRVERPDSAPQQGPAPGRSTNSEGGASWPPATSTA